MTGKVSFKPIYIISLLLGIGLILFSCLSPVDIQGFLDDDNVKSIIESKKGSVILTADSEGTAGDRRIYGLDSGKYYKIDVIEDGKVTYTGFVKAGGTLSEELKDIKKLTVTAITGLTNDVTYRVKSAIAYTNTNGIKYFTLNDTTLKPPATVTGGAVTISDSRKNCYFDLSTTINAEKYYEVMRATGSGPEPAWDKERTSAYRKQNPNIISITPEDYGNNYVKFNTDLEIGIFEHDRAKLPGMSPTFLVDSSVMKLPAIGSVNDYVFVEYHGTPAVTGDGFYYLTVTVNSAPPTDGNITVNSPDAPSEVLPTLKYLKNGSSTPTTINKGERIVISSSDAVENRKISADWASYWYYDDRQVISTSLVDNVVIGDSPLNNPGTYRIIVERSSGRLMYSTWFILEIKP